MDRDSNASNENFQGSISHNFRIGDVNDAINKAVIAVERTRPSRLPGS